METRDGKLQVALEQGLARAGLSVSPPAVGQLLFFLEQLVKWNRTHNLSGFNDPGRMLDTHLLDSLSLLPFLTEDSLADIGCGAGLPGLPLAICRPDMRFLLLDSNGKKTAFVFQVAAQLGLKNLVVARSRAEDYAIDNQVAIVTSRAFATLNTFIRCSEHLLRPGGRFLAMKGKYPVEELQQLPPGYYLEAAHSLHVPGLDASRHLLDIRRTPQYEAETAQAGRTAK
jgi:16S rRNA (guanine527-N7)-methyltransferase